MSAKTSAGGGRAGEGEGRFVRVSRNPRSSVGSSRRAAARGPEDAPRAAAALDPAGARDAAAEIRRWPEYEPTPLRELPGLADALGVERVWLKDESNRLGLGSFKALGGAYAVLRELQDAVHAETGRRPSARELRGGSARELVAALTVTAATAGNHGRSVAWGAERFGCGCVIFLPADASEARAAAIAAHGARLRIVEGGYDEAVRRAGAEAARQGWLVISDTAYPGYEVVPRRVMQGYALIADEVMEQLAGRGEPPPTHCLVQAGVGGLAAAVCGTLDAALGPDRPRFVAVEPWSADCIGRSLRAGRRRTVSDPFRTGMTCLACGEPSLLAWKVLAGTLDWALAVPDPPVAEAGRALAAGELGPAVELGPSGAAGVGAMLALSALPAVRRSLELDEESRVLALGTERPEAGVGRPGSG